MFYPNTRKLYSLKLLRVSCIGTSKFENMFFKFREKDLSMRFIIVLSISFVIMKNYFTSTFTFNLSTEREPTIRIICPVNFCTLKCNSGDFLKPYIFLR